MSNGLGRVASQSRVEAVCALLLGAVALFAWLVASSLVLVGRAVRAE